MCSERVHGGQPFRIRQAMSDTRGHITELLSKAINRGRLDDQLKLEDRDHMVAFLKLYGDLNKDGEYRGSERAGYKQTPGAFDRKGTAVDPLSMHELLDADLWIAILFDEFVDWQATMLQPVGGMDRISHAFESRLEPLIKRGEEVVALRHGERAVSVTHKHRADGTTSTLEADYVICTLPFNILAGIDCDFSPPVGTALRRVKYDHSLKVAFEAQRFWEAQQIYGGISYVKNDAALIWYPSHGFQTPNGIVLGAYANGEAAQRCGERLQRLTDVGLEVVLVALVFSAQGADDVVRTPLPDGNPFPISAAVTVRGDLDTVYVSGALPTVVDKNAPKGSIAAFGDMETQTVSTLNAVKSSLARLGLDMSHVVKMTVFMVGDPSKDNKVDFAGIMAGYTQFFGTPEQPNKPARSALQVAALVVPGALVEIEVIAVKPR